MRDSSRIIIQKLFCHFLHFGIIIQKEFRPSVSSKTVGWLLAALLSPSLPSPFPSLFHKNAWLYLRERRLPTSLRLYLSRHSRIQGGNVWRDFGFSVSATP